MLKARSQLGHVHAYTRELALATLEEAAFDITYERYHRIPPTTRSLRSRIVDGIRRSMFAISPHQTVRLAGGWSLLLLAQERQS